MSYFLFKSWKLPLRNYIRILLFFLIVALFFERYCFAVAVYKTKNYGFMLILLIISINTVFLNIIKRVRKKKHIKRLREVYSVDSLPQEGLQCAIAFVG